MFAPNRPMQGTYAAPARQSPMGMPGGAPPMGMPGAPSFRQPGQQYLPQGMLPSQGMRPQAPMMPAPQVLGAPYSVGEPVMMGADLGMLLGGMGGDVIIEGPAMGMMGPGGEMMIIEGGPMMMGPGGTMVMDGGMGSAVIMDGGMMMGPGGALVMDGGMIGPGGGQLVAMPQMPQSGQPIKMDDLPFSSRGHKAMWEGIFEMVQREVDMYLKSQSSTQGMQFKAPRIPMPNIPEQQIAMIFDSYDMEKLGYLEVDKIKALMRDMQCVTCLAMSSQKGEAMEEARRELTMMMGPQMASMMAGSMSQMMDFELQMVKHISMQDIPDEEVAELVRELDADRDGRISRNDFLVNAKKALFDPNPPEEIMQAMEAMEAAVSSGMPLALPVDGGMMVIEPMGGPMCGGMPMIGSGPMVMDGSVVSGMPGRLQPGQSQPSQSRLAAPGRQAAATLPSQQARAPQPARVLNSTGISGTGTGSMARPGGSAQQRGLSRPARAAAKPSSAQAAQPRVVAAPGGSVVPNRTLQQGQSFASSQPGQSFAASRSPQSFGSAATPSLRIGSGQAVGSGFRAGSPHAARTAAPRAGGYPQAAAARTMPARVLR